MLRVEQLEERRVLASTTFVDDDGLDCPSAAHDTIQAAVSAAGPNDTIIVCPGTYDEQVAVNTNGLKLRSQKPLAAIIQAPATPVDSAIVEVDGAENVEIAGFTIQGPISGAIAYGILVGDGGSARIQKNHITDIRHEPMDGAQTGVGILVFEAADADISHNLIDDYQKGGVVVDGTGSHAAIKHNNVIGVGPTGVLAQNGVQVSAGATAEVSHNQVSGNAYTGAFFFSAGILLFESGPTKVTHNQVSNNDVGIELSFVEETTTVSHNKIDGGSYYGLGLTGSSNIVVSHNFVSGSAGKGIWLSDASSGNLISNNQVIGNGEEGILIEDSDNNEITKNKSEDNGGIGIYVTGTSDENRITSNHAKNNLGGNYLDDSTGDNFWSKNKEQ
jgi:parallel beta-helix repeat protein